MEKICKNCIHCRDVGKVKEKFVCCHDQKNNNISKNHVCHLEGDFYKHKKEVNISKIKIKNCLLTPIHPEYAAYIYSGDKHLELRKKLSTNIDTLVLYETAPVSMITGLVRVDGEFKGDIDTDKRTKNIFNDILKYSCINNEEFDKYFHNHKTYYGYILNNEKKYIFKQPLPLQVLKLNKACQVQQPMMLGDNQKEILEFLIRKGY